MGKILILTNHSYMLYRFRLELLRQLAREHSVILSMPFVGHEQDFMDEGFPCVETALDRRSINPVKDAALLRFYRNLLRREKPELVITYSIKPNIYGGMACRLEGVPYCANVQGLGTAFQRPGLSLLVTGLYRLALHGAHTVFFENQPNAELFLRRRILSPEKVTVLPGAGINLKSYPCCPYPQNEPIRFLYLGRIMKEKGMDELFAAAQQLHSEGLPFRLDLVGFFEDAYKPAVEALEALGIARFHGFQLDPRDFYRRADCVVLPSYHEGMSNVLLEAAATGRPVITSDIPGCRESVEDGVSGLLCRARDVGDLTDKMRRMAALTPAQRREMGLAGRSRMERCFDKNAVVRATVAALPL